MSLQTPEQPAAHYSAPRAAPADRIAWPDAFGTRFTIFVDTEEEFDWNAPLNRDGHATSAMAALPAAHVHFADRGAALTYMVDYPIATDAAAIDALHAILDHGGAAIGAQLHAWVNPPFDEALTPYNSYPGNLPRTLEAAKIDALSAAIVAAFGKAPRAYRAGRYGIGADTLGLLAERGYALDSSMRAGYDYSADGGPDFTAIGNHAFRAHGLIELPLTTVFTGQMRRGGAQLHRALGRVPRGRGLFARAGLLSRVALTPEDMPLAEALDAVRVALDEGVRVLNFAFHSPSVAPGHTPYVRNAEDLADFHRWWDAMLDLLDRRGVRSASLEDLIAAAAR